MRNMIKTHLDFPEGIRTHRERVNIFKLILNVQVHLRKHSKKGFKKFYFITFRSIH
jgi:hypothetical protein